MDGLAFPEISYDGTDVVTYGLLTPGISEEDLDSFVKIVNSEWGQFYDLTPSTLMRRLETGNIFVGAYLGDRPAGILETIGLKLNYPRRFREMDYRDVMKEVCPQIGPYDELTDDGLWRPLSPDFNTLVLVDITRNKEFSSKSSIAPGIVNYGKGVMIASPEQRPGSFFDLEATVTFTPDIGAVKRWHERQWAFDTGVPLENARPGYIQPDVNFMCYLAPGSPRWVPKLGQRELPKSA